MPLHERFALMRPSLGQSRLHRLHRLDHSARVDIRVLNDCKIIVRQKILLTRALV